MCCINVIWVNKWLSYTADTVLQIFIFLPIIFFHYYYSLLLYIRRLYFSGIKTSPSDHLKKNILGTLKLTWTGEHCALQACKTSSILPFNSAAGCKTYLKNNLCADGWFRPPHHCLQHLNLAKQCIWTAAKVELNFSADSSLCHNLQPQCKSLCCCIL